MRRSHAGHAGHATPEEHARRPGAAGRRLARALGDAALIDAMRGGDPWAWNEFDERFRPLLERYAARIGIPRPEWSTCVTDVLDEEALRLTARGGGRASPPERLAAYLVRAVRNRHLRAKRAALSRERHYAAAASGDGEAVVRALCSEDALRASAGPEHADADEGAADDPGTGALRRLAMALAAELDEESLTVLGWAAAGVPHRQIAEWMGASYDATTKRLWRLCRRLRARAAEHIERLPPDERLAVRRSLRLTGGEEGGRRA